MGCEAQQDGMQTGRGNVHEKNGENRWRNCLGNAREVKCQGKNCLGRGGEMLKCLG